MIILDHVSKHYQTRDKQDFVAVEPTSLGNQTGGNLRPDGLLRRRQIYPAAPD